MKSWELEDAEVHFGDARFWNCRVEQVVKRDVSFGIASGKVVSGTLRFTHPAPESVFWGKKGAPESPGMVAESDSVTVEVDALLATNGSGERESSSLLLMTPG